MKLKFPNVLCLQVITNQRCCHSHSKLYFQLFPLEKYHGVINCAPKPMLLVFTRQHSGRMRQMHWVADSLHLRRLFIRLYTLISSVEARINSISSLLSVRAELHCICRHQRTNILIQQMIKCRMEACVIKSEMLQRGNMFHKPKQCRFC